MKIGGNIIALIQVLANNGKNIIGESDNVWVDVIAMKGFLDLSTGESKRTIYNTKVQESSHVFICDYKALKNLSTGWVWDAVSLANGKISTEKLDYEVDLTSENARMIVDGAVYNISIIDDPMGLHQHLEIYLKYVGGQNG